MPDWTRSMSQTFEYYLVNPNTWGDDVQIRDVTSCSIDRDSTADTLGSASIDFTEDHGEEYIREYLVTRQNDREVSTWHTSYSKPKDNVRW